MGPPTSQRCHPGSEQLQLRPAVSAQHIWLHQGTVLPVTTAARRHQDVHVAANTRVPMSPPAPPAHVSGQEEDLGVVPLLKALPALPIIPEQVSPGEAVRCQRHHQGHPLPARLGRAERGFLGWGVRHSSRCCPSRCPPPRPSVQCSSDGTAASVLPTHRQGWPGRSLPRHSGVIAVSPRHGGPHLQGQDVPCTDMDINGVQRSWQDDPLPFAVDGGVLNNNRKEQVQGTACPRGSQPSAAALEWL